MVCTVEAFHSDHTVLTSELSLWKVSVDKLAFQRCDPTATLHGCSIMTVSVKGIVMKNMPGLYKQVEDALGCANALMDSHNRADYTQLFSVSPCTVRTSMKLSAYHRNVALAVQVPLATHRNRRPSNISAIHHTCQALTT